MKYEYDEIEDFANAVGKCWIKVIPIEVDKGQYVNAVKTTSVITGEIIFNITYVEAKQDITPEEYNTITRATYLTVCDKLRNTNPKILIYKGAVHE